MIKKKMINQVEVVRPNVVEHKQEGFLNGTFNNPYESIAIISKRGSGISTLIYNLVKIFSKQNKEEDSLIIIISKTIHQDPIYKKLLELKKYPIKKDSKKDFLTFENKKSKEKYVWEPQRNIITYDGFDEFDDVLDLIHQNTELEILLIIDDCSSELKKDKRIGTLIKRLRHAKTTNIISTQDYHDVPPGLRKNIDTFIIFPKFAVEKMKLIHQEADVDLDFDVFLRIYKDATKNKYNFFFADPTNCDYRHNLNKRYLIE